MTRELPDPTSPASYAGQLAVLIDRSALGGAGRGIFFIAAAQTETETARIMAIEGRGILSIAMDEISAFRLGLRPIGRLPKDDGTPYHANSIEAVSCTETGISAAERALTMRTAGGAHATAADVTCPGHIMPLVVRNAFRDNLELAEISYLLVNAAGVGRVSGWCDILDDSGNVAGTDYCQCLAQRLGLPWFDAAEVRAFADERLTGWRDAARIAARASL